MWLAIFVLVVKKVWLTDFMWIDLVVSYGRMRHVLFNLFGLCNVLILIPHVKAGHLSDPSCNTDQGVYRVRKFLGV